MRQLLENLLRRADVKKFESEQLGTKDWVLRIGKGASDATADMLIRSFVSQFEYTRVSGYYLIETEHEIVVRVYAYHPDLIIKFYCDFFKVPLQFTSHIPGGWKERYEYRFRIIDENYISRFLQTHGSGTQAYSWSWDGPLYSIVLVKE